MSEALTENYPSTLEFISSKLRVSKTNNKKISSYYLKHRIEEELGVYVSNLDVKTALKTLGFKCTLSSQTDINQDYYLCKSSLKEAFKNNKTYCETSY
ncbi:MAG: hypothetical protein RR929_00845 [Erysipelotrichaceae bacterium]